MVFVPQGSFMMGDNEDKDDARPAHLVELKGFYIDKTEVTVGQFASFVKETGYITTAESAGKARVYSGEHTVEIEGACWKNPYGAGVEPDPKDPVTQVSWDDAVAFCVWAGKRLPTEAEWEYAARSTDGRYYPWGYIWDENRCRNAANSKLHAVQVGSYPLGEGPYEAFDQAGNVWEWCEDYYQRDYYSISPRKNPMAITPSKYRVMRGGGFASQSVHCKTTYRYYGEPAHYYVMVGFRCALDLNYDPAKLKE